ncbi:RagB/SusD family nutrient uptake outer membrane protein [Algibacter sp. 2305UL17-15]|uniref:RagB/SusD family nutrient uptake outer membrane protein n=1 Tax=Algibacter sp. 2305UL17-15 TaxID=3231268 RepID=UPI00345A91A1
MKTSLIKIIGLLVLPCLLFLTACDEDKFLTEVDPNNPTSETFWKSQEQFNSALTTVYGALQFPAVSGPNGLIYEMAKADISGTDFWQTPFSFLNLTYGSGAEQIKDPWDKLYIGIYRANQVIENIASIDASVFSEGDKEIIEGQARFLRAWFYFRLVNSFNGGVKRITVPTGLADVDSPFVSKEELTNDIIKPDLEFAMKNLPKTWGDEDKGRATWGAATALLGKVYLFEGEHPTARDLFKEVIDSNVYQLTANFVDNFTIDTELNSESIFEVVYNGEFSPGSQGGSIDDEGGEATNFGSSFGFLDKGGFNQLLGSYYLHELFVNDEVDPSNPINDGNRHSTRLTATLAVPDGEGTYYNEPTADIIAGRAGQSAYIRKWTNSYQMDQEPNQSRSGVNFRHMRLSDVYLMYAEAVLESGSSINDAIKYIDLVRSRAGVKTIQQYASENGNKIPQLHVSKQVHGTQPLVDINAQNLITHIRRVERPLELAFEGHRWKDLVRWGIVKEVYLDLREDEVWRNNNFDQVDGLAPLYIVAPLGKVGQVREDFISSEEIYNPSNHDYWPVPPAEQQTNNGLN